MLRAKLHVATVTEAHLEYTGSLTVDRDLLDAVDIAPSEEVLCANMNNGERFTIDIPAFALDLPTAGRIVN